MCAGTNNNEKIEKHIEKYSSSKEKYARFAESISQLLRQLLKASGLNSQSITFRAKEIEKLREKYQRKPSLIEKSLGDIQDLAGCRVIFYLEEKIAPFIEVLKREFDCVDFPDTKYDPTGYNATHIIIKLDERRSKLAEYAEFSGLFCEVQLTTVLFHAWSEINHDIIYKKEEVTEKFSKGDMDFIEEKLKEIMQNYLWKANYNFSFVVGQYERLKRGMQILNTETMKSLSESTSNDEILAYILKLNNFSGIYRLPKEFNFLEILNNLLVKALANDQTSGLKVIEASFDFIKNVVYWDYENIIIFCIDRIEINEYQKYCEANLLELSKYNLNVVKQIGYHPQKVLLEKIKEKRLSNRFNEFLVGMCKNLLSTSLQGNSQEQFNTFTFTQGPIYINEDLKKIREDTISLLFELMNKEDNCKFKKSIIDALFSSIKIHYDTMRKEDLEFLRLNAKSILLKILSDYSYIKDCAKREIESDLKYPSKPVFEGIEEVSKLIELINKDQEYQKYRAFIGYETDYGPDWRTVETDRKTLLNTFVDGINEQDVESWKSYIKAILNDYDKKDYSLFQNLHYFLNELGKKKPELGAKFKLMPEIQDFQVALLCGLLESAEKDKHYDEIKAWINKSERLLDIAVTFRFFSDYEPETFSELVENSLKAEDINQLVELLLTICKNYKVKKATTSQFIKIIQKFSEKEFFEWPSRVSFIMDNIIKDFSKEDYEIILTNLINKNDIGYDTEKILSPMAEKYPERIIKFFYQRVGLRKSGSNLIDSVPFSFQLLKEPLNKSVEKVVPNILKWLKEDDWKYKWEAGHLINIIFPVIDDKLKEIIIDLIKEKDSETLEQIFWVLDKYKGTSDVLGIVNEIIKNFKVTTKMRNRLFSILSHTGVVTGEYGLVEAYKSKIKDIQPWLSEDSEDTVEFAKGYIAYLGNAIKYENARVDKELDLMKSEFDRTKKV